MNNERDVELVERETLFQGYFRMCRYWVRHRLYAGGMGPKISREVFERGPAVAVLPYDPVRREVVLIEQFRAGAYAAGHPAWIVETIAGMVKPGEAPEEVAAREALEEAGLTFSGPLTRIARHFTSPGACDEYCDVMVGACDSAAAGGVHGLADEHEDIRVLVLPFGRALEMVERAEILGGPAVMALFWLKANESRTFYDRDE